MTARESESESLRLGVGEEDGKPAPGRCRSRVTLTSGHPTALDSQGRRPRSRDEQRAARLRGDAAGLQGSRGWWTVKRSSENCSPPTPQGWLPVTTALFLSYLVLELSASSLSETQKYLWPLSALPSFTHSQTHRSHFAS